MMYGLYRLFTIIAYPFVLLFMLMLAALKPAWRSRWGQHFGWWLPPVSEAVIWIHAASVGEVQVALQLISDLRNQAITAPILLTTTTLTGKQQASDQSDAQVIHCYMPFDFHWIVTRFIG